MKRKTYKLYDIENYPEYHKEMWEWLAEHPDKDKKDWFDEFWKSERLPFGLCFGCEVGYRILNKNFPACLCCDFSSKNNYDCCFGLFEVYERYKSILKIISQYVNPAKHIDPNVIKFTISDLENVTLNIKNVAKQIADLDCSWMVEDIENYKQKSKSENQILYSF